MIRTRIQPFLFLIPLFLIVGCGDGPPDPSPRVRWFDPIQIDSVDTNRWDIHNGEIAVHSEELSPFLTLDKDSDWFTFYPLADLARDSDHFDVPDLSQARSSMDQGFLAEPVRGFGCLSRIDDEQNTGKTRQRIYAECKGDFIDDPGNSAIVIQLHEDPEFSSPYEPGQLKRVIRAHALETHILPSSDDGRYAGKVIEINNHTRYLLFLFVTGAHKKGYFEWAKFTKLSRHMQLLLSRNEKDWDHPQIYDEYLTHGVVYPSLFMVPKTAITFKETDLLPTSTFRCVFSSTIKDHPPVKVSLVLDEGRDSQKVMFERVVDDTMNGWMPVTCDLGNVSGRDRRFTLICDWVGEQARLDRVPVIFCGAPIIRNYGVRSSEPRGSDARHSGNSEEKPPWNLIIVSIDTLRPDHMGCYGYSRPTSPIMDRFAKENILFKNVYAQSPYTLPSHVSLFTSQYPTTHGVYSEEHRIARGTTLLSEVLAQEGWATACFCNGGYLSHEYGFQQGFDLYCEVDPIGHRYFEGTKVNKNRLSDGSLGSLDMAFEWIEDHADFPFYLFLHTFMVHEFLPPRAYAELFNDGMPAGLDPLSEVRKKINNDYFKEHGWTAEELAFFKNMYDGGIRASDDMFGELLEFLDANGLSENTIIVMTSDHGEEFLEHGGRGHSYTIYDELIRIPMIMKIPGFKTGATEIEATINQVDVLPSVLELMGIDGPPYQQGRSFVPLLTEGNPSNRTVYAEVDLRNRSTRKCVIQGEWKYILGDDTESLMFPAPANKELFRLSEDPGEQRNRAEENPEVLEKFEALLNKIRKDMDAFNDAMGLKREESGKVSRELEEVLRQQGYL